MSRNKNPEVTVNRILDTAYDLFIEKGYEQTTIQDIVNNLEDLSKGAIYHHFKSKEEIIDAVIQRMDIANKLYEDIKSKSSLDGLHKIKVLIIESVCCSEQRQLYRSASTLLKNPKFLSKQLNLSINKTAPIFKEYIIEGIDDGSINTEYPEELSEIIMITINIWLNPGVFDVDIDKFKSKIVFTKKMFENLGIPIIDDEIIECFIKFYEIKDTQ